MTTRATLTETIKTEELLTLPANEVLWRLYHEEEVTVYDPQDVEFKCTCSRERCADALKTLPDEEVDSIWRKMAKLTCIVITAVTTICSMRWILLKSATTRLRQIRKFINEYVRQRGLCRILRLIHLMRFVTHSDSHSAFHHPLQDRATL